MPGRDPFWAFPISAAIGILLGETFESIEQCQVLCLGRLLLRGDEAQPVVQPDDRLDIWRNLDGAKGDTFGNQPPRPGSAAGAHIRMPIRSARMSSTQGWLKKSDGLWPLKPAIWAPDRPF